MAITSRLLARRCSKAAGGLSRLFGMPISTRACLLSEHNVSIDTAGLNRPQSHSHGDAPGKEPETEMAKHIKSIIRFRGGPVTLAEYMSEALTNSQAGYYINRDVFGTHGDFVTSPEISQLFVWQQMGSPSKMRLVELGPGRGTLMSDLLRGTAPFKPFMSGLDVHLVEVSKFLRLQQWDKLQCHGASSPTATTAVEQQQGTSMPSGTQVHWHRSLDEVPDDTPTIYIAQEFFDALPVHQFQKTERGWCERLVDVASDDSPLHFRLVLGPHPTPASKLLVNRRLDALPFDQKAAIKGLEISPQAMSAAGDLASRVASNGGAALLIDYGRDRPYPASLQAIRQHKFCGLLEQPGMADLSAHVDFGAIRQGVSDSTVSATCHGPISQRQFLQALGIEARLQSLLQNADADQAEMLQTGYLRLTGGAASAAASAPGNGRQKGEKAQEEESQPAEAGMGLTYKAMAIIAEDAPVPVSFEEHKD